MGGGRMTLAGLACAACGTELPPNSKFCNKCGAAVSAAAEPAEYKQVTILFADVVHSMDIAAAVGAERHNSHAGTPSHFPNKFLQSSAELDRRVR
jgi:uncharacterized OB-fold protein